ncbi:MAG: proline dehydrogenase family protein [Dehalococcoidia bacterium]
MALLKNILLWTSKNEWMSQKLPKYKFVQNSLSRFMPGEFLSDALEACEKLEYAEHGTIITYLGENVTLEAGAYEVVDHYKNALSVINESSLNTLISVKLTQLGLDFDMDLCMENLNQLLKLAKKYNSIIWIDMEEYRYLEQTLEIFKKVSENYHNIGITLQAYLHRTDQDLDKLLSFATNIRLVKGAYNEHPSLAIKNKDDIDINYRSLSKKMLEKDVLNNGFKPSFATHDDRIIDYIINESEKNLISSDAYEFNMLYGIRKKLQKDILNSNQNLKILISYGEQWFPWYIRRIAENPKNLFLLLK